MKVGENNLIFAEAKRETVSEKRIAPESAWGLMKHRDARPNQQLARESENKNP